VPLKTPSLKHVAENTSAENIITENTIAETTIAENTIVENTTFDNIIAVILHEPGLMSLDDLVV